MPLPQRMTHFNLRVANHVTTPFAARLPGFGVLEHVGRRSGTVRRTPISLLRRATHRYVIALYYGPDVEWLANVLAAGHCRARTEGQWITLVEPRRFHDPSRRAVPRILRPVLALLGVDEFVELRSVS